MPNRLKPSTVTKIATPGELMSHGAVVMTVRPETIIAAAELHPRGVRALVYLAAFLLPPGITPPMVMRNDSEPILRSSLVVDEVHRTLSVRDEALKDVFYGDCSDEDVAWARVRLRTVRPRPRPRDPAEDVPGAPLPETYSYFTFSTAFKPVRRQPRGRTAPINRWADFLAGAWR